MADKLSLFTINSGAVIENNIKNFKELARIFDVNIISLCPARLF